METLIRKAFICHRDTKWIIGCGNLDKPSRITSAKRFFWDLPGGASDYFEYSASHEWPKAEDAARPFELLEKRRKEL